MEEKRDEKIARVGRVTTESVFKCTGKHWHEWIGLLEKAGARSWTHQEIAAYLKKKYKLGPWWQQGVTSGFELVIGRRMEGQNAKGEYMVTTTKSLRISAAKAWAVLVSEKGLRTWLRPLSPVTLKTGAQFETTDGFFGEIRTMTKGRQIRMTWQDPNWERKTVVQLLLVARPGPRSILCFNHMEIKAPRIQRELRARWKQIVADLSPLLSKEDA